MKIHPRLDRLRIALEGFRPEARASFRHALECESCRHALLAMLGESGGVTESTALTWPSTGQESYGDIFERFLADFERYRGEEAGRRESAGSLADELCAMSRDEREVSAVSDPSFRSLRVADELLTRSRLMRKGDPAESESLARLALMVADSIDPDTERPTLVEDLRLRSWTYVATARLAGGQLAAAAEALRMAEEHLASGSHDVTEAALVVEAKAILRRKQGELSEAERLFARAGEMFESISDHLAVYRSTMNLANVYNMQGRLDDAVNLLRATLEALDEDEAPTQALSVRHNLLDSLVEAGRVMEAQAHLVKSRAAYENHGDPVSRIRLRWIEAKLALATGQAASATEELRAVRDALVEVDLGFDAALACLELALLHLERGDHEAAKTLAVEMLPIFQAQDVPRHALAALTVFQQAASQQQLSVALVAHIQSYMGRVRNDPSVVYEPLVGA